MNDLFSFLPDSAVVTTLTVLAVLRLLIKGANYVIAKTPDKHDDAFLSKLKASPYYIGLEWILDVSLGIKLPEKKPSQE